VDQPDVKNDQMLTEDVRVEPEDFVGRLVQIALPKPVIRKVEIGQVSGGV